jgi:uncharacterized protein
MKSLSVLPFSTQSGGEYLFDNLTGTVLPVNKIMKDALELYKYLPLNEVKEKLSESYTKQEVTGVLDFIDRWYSNYGGFFRSDSIKESVADGMKTYTYQDVEKIVLENTTYLMILNLTEDCNLRCRYCYYSDEYIYSRSISKRKMDLDTGIRALDYYFNLLTNMSEKIPNKHAGLSFYGGEPLLAFDVLKNLVKYVKQNAPIPIVITITTNGTLLSEQIMEFIVQNDITLIVSMDGSQKNHDRNRIFPNGQGSFDIVFRNIKHFQQLYPHYEKLMIASVYDLKTDFEANIQFFDENKLPPIVLMSKVLPVNTNYYQQYSQTDFNNFEVNHYQMERKYFEYKTANRKIPNYLGLYNELNYAPALVRPRYEDIPDPMTPFTGTCLPGSKINIRVDGTIDMCERINCTMPIGDIYEGINFETIKNYIDNYNDSITNECFDCPVNRNCSLCFALCTGDGKFERPIGWCDGYKLYMKRVLSQVYSILEKRTDAFNYFEFVLKDTILLNA